MTNCPSTFGRRASALRPSRPKKTGTRKYRRLNTFDGVFARAADEIPRTRNGANFARERPVRTARARAYVVSISSRLLLLDGRWDADRGSGVGFSVRDEFSRQRTRWLWTKGVIGGNCGGGTVAEMPRLAILRRDFVGFMDYKEKRGTAKVCL